MAAYNLPCGPQLGGITQLCIMLLAFIILLGPRILSSGESVSLASSWILNLSSHTVSQSPHHHLVIAPRSSSSAETHTHTFDFSDLDYCIALLHGTQDPPARLQQHILMAVSPLNKAASHCSRTAPLAPYSFQDPVQNPPPCMRSSPGPYLCMEGTIHSWIFSSCMEEGCQQFLEGAL